MVNESENNSANKRIDNYLFLKKTIDKWTPILENEIPDIACNEGVEIALKMRQEILCMLEFSMNCHLVKGDREDDPHIMEVKALLKKYEYY